MKPPILLNHPDAALIKAHLKAADSDAAKNSLGSTPAGRKMLAADPDRRADLAALGITLWIRELFRDAGKVASALLRADQAAWTPSRIGKVVKAAAELNRPHPNFRQFQWFPHKPLISAAEKAVELHGLTEDLRAALEHWRAAVMPRELTPQEERELGEAERIALNDNEQTPWSVMSEAFLTLDRLKGIRTPLAEERKLIQRLSDLLPPADKSNREAKEPALRIDTTDAVGIKIAADVAPGGRAAGGAWAELLQHARKLTATVPASKWSNEAARLVAAVNAERFGECVADWFNEVGKTGPKKLMSFREVADVTLLNDCSVELLKGLAWAAAAARRTDLAPALGNLAESCCKKLPGIGPRNVKVGNAAIAALAAFEDAPAAAQLSRVRLRVRHPSSRAAVDKALTALSRKIGISPDDLADMSVPAFDLDEAGLRRVKFGDCACELRVASAQKVELRWLGRDGKTLKSPPAIVRQRFGEELKRLQREVRDASAMVAAKALRLERSYLSDRSWPLETWEKYFRRHPLTGTLVRRLIWQFDGVPAFPVGGDLLTAEDRAVRPGKKAVVTLWHPIHSQAEQVLAWREWLERREMTQPFKQAHRELYVLTDAERRTESYSNRFAGHILRQHQFAALCQQRGWEYRLQGEFDSCNTPTLNLPAHGLNAGFWVEGVARETSPQGIFIHVASDQVRFGRPLANVALVVFSEVMRDVDLFVGVASVANDPTWFDRGPGLCRTYWDHWSFGDLSESAKNRKTILESLLPRLAQGQKFSLRDRFLVVRGRLRTYKIHLGSGNVLMEPNDQYLCVVPDRGAASSQNRSSLFLPFEGDLTLSVILSKALLLAADDKIKDPTILRQIGGKGVA